MFDDNIDLELMLNEDRAYLEKDGSLGDRMIQALADEFSAYYVSYAAHWNIQGPNFPQLHDLFKESADLCQEAIDQVAEQARMLGVYAPLTVNELIPLASASHTPPNNSAQALVVHIAEWHSMLRSKYNDIAKHSNDAADVNDLASSLAGKHAKMAWKLHSTATEVTNG